MVCALDWFAAMSEVERKVEVEVERKVEVEGDTQPGPGGAPARPAGVVSGGGGSSPGWWRWWARWPGMAASVWGRRWWAG